ncbi:FecR family protein [Sphingobacterium sp. HJSM2_6]|uniref:FecR family protein n=1 Tax=Sphingobacterium sp. HJSM2_6 TaxID=3366264 RepID=UPI003BCB754D
MDQEKSLIKKYLTEQVSDRERDFVESWVDQLGEDKEISAEELLSMINSLDRKMGMPPIKKSNPYKRALTIAASLLVFFMAGYAAFYFWNKQEIVDIQSFKAPSSDNAIIVLDDNQEYDLNKLKVGDTIHSNNYHITRLSNGEVCYVVSEESSALVYNTLRTKVGGTASVLLSDGTKVWLNVNSELRYPVQFASNQREVFLKGEGYFEVEKLSESAVKIPFYVRSDQHSISVLGTKFNVNVSKDFETALLEGKVAIGKGAEQEEASQIQFMTNILPNEVYSNGQIIQVDQIEHYIDWKEGYFNLYNQSLKDLSGKLSNWYGIKVKLDPDLADSKLVGRISRTKDLKEVLEIVAEAIPMDYHIANGELIIQKQQNKK